MPLPSSSFLTNSPTQISSFPLIRTTISSPFSSFPTSHFSLSFLRLLKPHHCSSLNFSKQLKKFPSRPLSPPSLASSFRQLEDDEEEEGEEEEPAIGDCVVFEEGIFEDPYLKSNLEENPVRKKKPKLIKPENLVPDEWKEAQEEINLSKKEKRMILQQQQFGSRLVKRKPQPAVLPNMEDHASYKALKLSQLNPVVLDNPRHLPAAEEATNSGSGISDDLDEEELGNSSSSRVAPRNPRLRVANGDLEDITKFFNSGNYNPGEEKKTEGRRQLFTKEEKVLLNKRIPNLADATSIKWLPLHTLAASGEFYLVDMLLKHNVDINATDKDGLTALHKAILGKKQAITNYLLRESANPFVRDKEGATLMHYAVLAASSQAIKILLLYNVDINLADDDGWTPLHLAVQTQRTDVIRLLLIKGADETLKNRDGLTPVDLCLYLGRALRTYELIKLLKGLPKSR